MDDDTASEDEDDTANEGAAFKISCQQRQVSSIQIYDPLKTWLLLRATIHLKRQNQLRLRMERILLS